MKTDGGNALVHGKRTRPPTVAKDPLMSDWQILVSASNSLERMCLLSINDEGGGVR
jgi:hypothetical protein